jgi:hypothetical protein
VSSFMVEMLHRQRHVAYDVFNLILMGCLPRQLGLAGWPGMSATCVLMLAYACHWSSTWYLGSVDSTTI